MWKSLCSLFKKDCRMMASGKFFFVTLGSLLLYTLFINFGYLNFMHAEIYNVYLYDPAGIQTEVSPLVHPVSSLEELDAALARDINGVGVGVSDGKPSVVLYTAAEKADRHRADYALALLRSGGEYTPETVGRNTPEMKQRKDITCELLFIEIVAVGFLGIASVLFKEKQMGVIRVHAIMPLKKNLFVFSKIFLFLLTDLAFAVLMILFNVGLAEAGAAVPDGQYEAAKLLGYSKSQTFFHIVMPQVIKRIIPAVANETITLVKDTSLAFTLAVAEVFTLTKQLVAAQSSVVPFIVAGVFYYIFNLVVAMFFDYLEKKLSYYR